MPILLPKLKSDYPNLNLNIIEAQTDVLLNKISSGEIELTIMALPFNTNGFNVQSFGLKIFIGLAEKMIQDQKKLP